MCHCINAQNQIKTQNMEAGCWESRTERRTSLTSLHFTSGKQRRLHGASNAKSDSDVCFATENIHPAVRERKCDITEAMTVIILILTLQKLHCLSL